MMARVESFDLTDMAPDPLELAGDGVGLERAADRVDSEPALETGALPPESATS